MSNEAEGIPAPQTNRMMSVARWREHAKQEAARRADELSTYPSERSTSLRDRLRKERPPAAALECGEQARTRRFMLSNRARLILMIEPSEGAILLPTSTWLAPTVYQFCRMGISEHWPPGRVTLPWLGVPCISKGAYTVGMYS